MLRVAPLKRTKRLRVEGHSDTAQLKQEIQDTVRDIVILRDGGCIFRNIYFGIPQCGGYRQDGELILQGDHLVTRGNSATYADTRLIVCLCKAHHGWKSLGSNLNKDQYDALVKTLLPPDRVKLWEAAEAARHRGSHRNYTSDWRLELAALKHELRTHQRP
jgi:hypothetical protein